MNIQRISIKDIEPNKYNPNYMGEKIEAGLYATIKDFGMLQPVLVYKEGNKYVIIDGEHRYKQAQSLGHSELDCVVIDIKDGVEAKKLTIAMNRLRGEFDALKLSETISELRDHFGDDKLKEYLGYEKKDLEAYDNLSNLDTSEFDLDVDAQIESLMNEFNIRLKGENYAQIKALLPEDSYLSDFLVSLCTMYLSSEHPEVLEEVMNRKEGLEQIE